MKPSRSLFGIAILLMVTVIVSPWYLGNAQAFRGEEGDRVDRGEREGGSAEGPRGGAVVEGPHGGAAAEGPRGGTVVEGPRGDAAVEGPRGGAAAEGPDGGATVRGPQEDVYVNRAVGDRVAVLPYPINTFAVGGQTYYMDSSGFYYQPCTDDNTVYCVVTGP